MKKKKFLPQLNKSSFLKLIVFVAIVVLVEIAAGLFIFNEYSAKTYRQEFASYGGRADTLSYNVNEKYSSELDGLNGNTELIEKIKADCKLSAQFDYYVIFSEGQGGVVFGSEISGGIEEVNVSKCLFEGTERGLRIKTLRGRGRIGKCDGVTFSDIVMKNVKVPFVINMYYNSDDESGHNEYVWTTEKLPVDDKTPQIGSFVFKDMVCTGVAYSAAVFHGLPESPIKSITFDHVSFTYNENAEEGYPVMQEKKFAVKNQGLDFRFVERVLLKNVVISGQIGEPVLTQDVKKIAITK